MFPLTYSRISWRRKWQPTPVFLPRKSHGQRNLAGYSPYGHKESDMTGHMYTYCPKKAPWGLAQLQLHTSVKQK